MPIAVRSLEATVEKYLRNCIRAYFEGRTLRWIVGVIDGAVDGGAKAQARIVVETRFGQYAGTQAYRDLHSGAALGRNSQLTRSRFSSLARSKPTTTSPSTSVTGVVI